MATKYPMRLRQLVVELRELLEQHGNVEVVMETEVKGCMDENSIDHVEAFHIGGLEANPVVVAVCSIESLF